MGNALECQREIVVPAPKLVVAGPSSCYAANHEAAPFKTHWFDTALYVEDMNDLSARGEVIRYKVNCLLTILDKEEEHRPLSWHPVSHEGTPGYDLLYRSLLEMKMFEDLDDFRQQLRAADLGKIAEHLFMSSPHPISAGLKDYPIDRNALVGMLSYRNIREEQVADYELLVPKALR